MSKFRLTFPRPIHTTITYGNDTARGFFCTVVRNGEKVAQYDRNSADYADLEGLLKTLIVADVLSAEGVAEAYDWLPVVDDLCEIPSDTGRLAAAIIDNLTCGD